MATGGDHNDISEPLSLMETEGIETVPSTFKGNAVAPEGRSFFEPPLIAKVPGEETCRKQIDQVPMELAEKERPENEKKMQKDEGFDITEVAAAKENAVVDETKQIAEKDKQVNDVTGTILQIEEPCLNTGEEKKTSKHVEAIENTEAEVEGKPKSIEKEIGGPEKNEEEARKIEERVELETSKDVSSFDPSLSQVKEAQSQTSNVTTNNLDNLETVKDVCLENESKDNSTDDKTGVIDEQHIAEERFEGVEEKSESCSRFLDEKAPDVVEAIEEIENEKEGSTCDIIGGGTSIVEAGIDIRNDKEAISEIGECVQDKLNTEDIATVAHKTQEKQTEEVNSQQVDKPDICIVSETESKEIVKKSPEEGETVILEKTAEAGSSGGENINDEMHHEQKHDGLFVKHEERKQSTSDDLAMGDESTEKSKDIENHNVLAADNNTSDAVPITISTAQEHSTIAEEDKIMDAVTTTAPEPEHSKEESSNYEDKMEEKFAQQDEAENEKIENSLKLISGEKDTATSSECSEKIVSAKEDTKEERPIDADANIDNGLPIQKGLPPTDLNENIEDAELDLQNKNSSVLHISHSLEQETILVQGKKQPKVSDFEPQEANGLSTDLEKHAEDASEACESIKNTNLGHLSAEGAITTEVSSKASEMYVEKVERVHELESEEKLEIDDTGTNLEGEMQKKEETHDEQKQTCQMATTSGTTEEVSSDKVCSREFVDKKVEHSVQAAGLQEAETPLRNEVELNYGKSNIINEELNGEPEIKDIGEVIDEEKIKDDTTRLSSEVIHEKVVESSQDNEMETELSKEEYVEEHTKEDKNAKVILQESIQEASVNNFQNNGKIAEKSSREMYEVSEAANEVETNNNDESPDSTRQTSPLKEHESQRTENLTVAAEEKDEDRSSIRDEDGENNSGLKEVKECSEQETLKGEDVEQMLPKNEPRENLEHSASLISAGTEEGALNEMTQTTEEEIVEGVEDITKEAEMGKEDGEEYATDETNTKSVSQESIKEVPVSNLPNDEKNAEEFKGEIFEESVTAGINERIAHAMYQNDGTPNTALQTSMVKEVEIVLGEGKDTSPAEALPEEEAEHDRARGLKMVEDTSSEVRLEQDLEKSDEETSKTIDAVSHESNQDTEFPISTLEISPVEEQASLQRDNPTPAETSSEEKKYEDGSSTKKDEDNEKNTELAEEKHNAGETLKAEENLEQILQNNELKENPEQSITMICVETETDAFAKMVDNHEDEIVEIHRGNAEAELHKEEDTEGYVIEKSKITSLLQESAEEGLTKNFQNATKNSEKSIKEMFESQIAGGDETNQNDEDCNSSLPISLAKQDESFKGEDKNITPAEDPPHDEKEQHGSSDGAGEGNDSNPELLVTNQDSVRDILKVEEDFEQELQKIEPGEPEESSTVMAAETEVGTLSDKIDEITSPEEVFTGQNIEETVEKEKKEGSEDTDVTEVKIVVMEEDLKLVAEASDANKSVDNDVEEEIMISGGKEVKTQEKTFELGSIRKLGVEEARENMDEEIKHEGIKELYGDTKLASLSVDAEKHITTEEHTSTDISRQTTGEKTAKEKAKTEKEMREESVITNANEDIAKKVPEEDSAINDQSRIIYEGDETRMLVELEVHEIIQTTEEYEDIGKQGSVIEDNFEAPLSGTNEENPLHQETKDVSAKVKPNNEVDSNSEFTEPIEANKSLIEISSLESKSKEEILQEVKPDVNDFSTTTITGITREMSFKEEEPEDKRQIESLEPAHQEKGPVTKYTERTLETVDIDAKPENASNFIENKDRGIPAASGAEELENEMHKETAIMGSEDNKEETINETPLGNVLDDKQECSTMPSKESELMTNEGSKTVGENSTTYENRETPQTPQETEVMLKEDVPINARDASKSVDSKIESINEEVRSYQFDNLKEHHELDNEKQEGREISKLEEVRDLANQGASYKLMSIEDEDSSNVGDETSKHIEAISAERKEAILEEENSTKKSEDSLTEDVEANKAAFELESGTNNQKQAIGTKDFEVLVEENFEVAETRKKLEGVSETETRYQSSKTIPEIDPGKVENMIEIQNESTSESMEQSSQESREVQKEIEGKTELKFEAPGDVKETQNADETVKDVILTEEVHKEVKKADSETLKCMEKEMSDTRELYAKSIEDERVHEIKESSLVSSEYHKATESNEQTAIVSSDVQEAPTMEEMSVAKAIEDEDSEMPAVLSTATPAKESEEIIKIMEEEDKCCDNIKATTMVEITKTSLEEAQLDEQTVQASTIISNDNSSHTIEAEACQQEKSKDNMALELHSSNLASQIPNDDHENITREHVAQENKNADHVQENKRASDVVYESKGHGITEEIEKSSKIVESQGAEATTNEVATDETLPEVIPKEEQGISPTTERMEEKMKGVEVLADHPKITEDVPLQKEDCRQRDLSQLELQSNEDIPNQSPNEVLEEQCGTPDETKEEIKRGPELVSITDSQGFEALKEDESTSAQTALEEKLEEQNQTLSVASLSRERACEAETTIENIEEYGQEVEIPADPQNSSSPKTTEATCLHKEVTNELEVSGLGVELDTGIQKDSLNEAQIEESKSPDDASKLQTPEYETSKEASESVSEVHGHKDLAESEETEIKEKHPELAITDLAAAENQCEEIIDATEIKHDEVIEAGTFGRTSNLRTEITKEAFKSISAVHGHEVLAESEDTESKEKDPEVAVTDWAAEENQSERTIDATESIHDELTNEKIMEEKEDANHSDPVTRGEETTKESQEEYELKAEESLRDKGTAKNIQNEELCKEVEKANGYERIEKQMDTERIIEHLQLAAVENETIKQTCLDKVDVKNVKEAGSELHLENQSIETTCGNDGRTEAATVKEEKMDVEISQKEGATDLVEVNEATQEIHEGEETSKTTAEHIKEHVKEVEIEVDEHPQDSSSPKTTENTCSQKEEIKEQEVCGLGVECNTNMQKNGSNEFDKEEGRTSDEDSTLQPQGYGNKIKDKEHPPESEKMTEIAETGAFEKTSDLRTETSEEAFESVSEVHEHEVLAESEVEYTEIKEEKDTEVAVTDLVAGKNQNEKTIDATEIMHDELTNEELTKQDKQQAMEEKKDAKNCSPITLGEETTKENHQMYDLKAEESQEDMTAKEFQNEEVSNEGTSEYLHQTAVEDETIKESFPDEALVKNAEDMGTKPQVENQSDQEISAYDKTEATTITNEEFGGEISEKESLQAPGDVNENTQDIHQGGRDSDSTSGKPISIEAEPQETRERKKDAPQGLLQEPLVEATQSAQVGESQPANAIEIIDSQGPKHGTEKRIDENNIKGADETMSAKISLLGMMQKSTRERQVGRDVKEEKEANASREETRLEGEKTKSDEEEGEEHKQTDSGSDAPVMVEASRDMVDVKVAHKKSHNILSGVGSKVKHSISKVKKAITGKSSHPKHHSPR